MIVARTAAHLRELLDPRRPAGPIGLVPTMGALHEGHRSLFTLAREASHTVVASVFVNPRQFNDAADLAAYPRQEARDAEIARATGVDVLFAPAAAEIYPPGHATSVEVGGAALEFEGERRPGHFAGVATVCTVLFNLVRPDVTWFGQKDAQQIAVIRQVVRDLRLDVAVRVGPTVRDADGLALSSRNERLSPDDRRRAAALPAALRAALDAHRSGGDPLAAARARLAGLDVDYVSLAAFDGVPTLVLAVRFGAVRLIDNVPLDAPALAGL